jgi:hypothetical protein
MNYSRRPSARKTPAFSEEIYGLENRRNMPPKRFFFFYDKLDFFSFAGFSNTAISLKKLKTSLESASYPFTK